MRLPVIALLVLVAAVFAQEPPAEDDLREKHWDASKWAQVISSTMNRLQPKMFRVKESEWKKHADEVNEWLNRQKSVGAITAGGCYKSFGTRPFAKFWYREEAKRFKGEPHFLPVSWMGVVTAGEQDAKEGVDQIINYCAYQTAPDKAAPHPPRPGEVPTAPTTAYIHKTEGNLPTVMAVPKVVRNLVGADERPPPNPKPRITFSSRYTIATATNRESPFKFKQIYDAASADARGYCTADVSAFTDVANHNLCPSGATNSIAYAITVHFFPLVLKSWQFRLGASFSFGGSTFIDEQPEDARAENLNWQNNWQSEDVFVAPRRTYAKGKWHSVTFYGLSQCCDDAMSLQFDVGTGWTDLTVAKLMEAQVSGWKPGTDSTEGMALGRGEGTSSFSVVESGTCNFGTHQKDWALHESDGITTYTQRVEFGVFFNWTPVVQVYLRRLDAARDTNVRVFVRAKNVESTGFDLVIVKYGDSKVFQVGVSWFAFDADPMFGTKFGHACARGSYLDNQSLPVAPKTPTPLLAAGSFTPPSSAPGGGGSGSANQELEEELLYQFPSSSADELLAAAAMVPAFQTVPLQQWTLHEFSGFRKYETAVAFRDPLPDPPKHAFVGLNMIDAAAGANLVTSVKLFNLGERGVDFEFNVAGNSRVLAEGACMLSWNPVRREIESGEAILGVLTQPDRWNLSSGTGLREFYHTVPFKSTFQEPPTVTLGITHVNSAGNNNLRFDVTVHQVTSNSFTLRAVTWGQSKVLALTVSYLATADGRTNGLSPESPGKSNTVFFDPRTRSTPRNNDEWAEQDPEKSTKDRDDDKFQKLSF